MSRKTRTLRRGEEGIEVSIDGGSTWNVIAYWTDFQSVGIIHQTQTNLTIRPSVLNIWGEVESLTIAFGAVDDTLENEFKLQFESGSTPTTLTLPEGVIWYDGEVLECEPDYVYQVSILNNLAVYAGFPKA